MFSGCFRYTELRYILFSCEKMHITHPLKDQLELNDLNQPGLSGILATIMSEVAFQEMLAIYVMQKHANIRLWSV